MSFQIYLDWERFEKDGTIALKRHLPFCVSCHSEKDQNQWCFMSLHQMRCQECVAKREGKLDDDRYDSL